ncbi:DUF7739 domain-containing protein [Streptomyces nymphaeiformis]|uniref:DUF7739 domain-containing protein n=1 Tax=Streptomyces nymphaeiformis TaxID=2663842 RepID=A0A7W7U7E0_9ACTN|nr:hypothetical protein [Streptomyces nymphaeiformis]MBB4985005.1 hypothetical protein [Streptomyces nymphaeiformis]
MGYRISHNGTESTLSYLQIEQLGVEVKRAASTFGWMTLRPLFAPSRDGYMEIDAAQAAKHGKALLKVAGKLPDGWDRIARRIGESAERAARANEPWVWS